MLETSGKKKKGNVGKEFQSVSLKHEWEALATKTNTHARKVYSLGKFVYSCIFISCGCKYLAIFKIKNIHSKIITCM